MSNKMIKNVLGIHVMGEGPKEAKEVNHWTPWGNLKFDSFSLYKQEREYFLLARFRREGSRATAHKLTNEQVKGVKKYKEAQSVMDFWVNHYW